jgi:superfamily II DNA/RNA helicase
MSYQNKSRSARGARGKSGRSGATPGFKKRKAQRPKRGEPMYINPSKFVKRVSGARPAVSYVAKHRFADFSFGPELQANIARKGYQTPSAIQDQAIPLALAGRDVIGLANTGTGKTAAFLLPIINKLHADKQPFSTIILAPTRELAQQIEDQLSVFAYGLGIHSVLLVGGSNIDRQMARLRRKPQVVIATPGRMMDLTQRNNVPLERVHTFVLDEADRMLDMGFVGDIRKIASGMPKERQTLFFSATITARVKGISEEFLRNPITISAVTSDTSERVDQDIIEVGSSDEKMEKLLALLGEKSLERVLLFGKTKHGVQRLSDNLCKKDIKSVAIHGNRSQSQRKRALEAFKSGDARVMVATDVAARGLDIPNVSHVINFDQPMTYEDYIHRIGRTGRGEATGIAWTFVDKAK